MGPMCQVEYSAPEDRAFSFVTFVEPFQRLGGAERCELSLALMCLSVWAAQSAVSDLTGRWRVTISRAA
jgi:hypothetical protein